ncbi:hypothetical protein [Tepidiforma sp.]|uniref:hypothetical protein n=1 Tax=Tepidiforma sp. TaxID=2682230 RepID=UPI0026122DAB|nr:hypothetical protein [Tepidiforma sp.]MCX7617729.1 hypothetical protein [Tepidiforma sp.]
MVRSSRRFFVFAALALLAAVVSVGQLRLSETPARAAYDPSGPAWDPLSTFDASSSPAPVLQPPKLLAGTNSHGLPANAQTRNGYCLDVNVPGVTAAAIGTLGFVITATNPINPADPPAVNVPVPTSGTYAYGAVGPAAGADYDDGGTPADTSDDVYCVVAYAPPGYQTLSIAWHWDGTASVPNPIILPDIAIVTVTLDKIGDGIVGGPAEVCTTGWDSTFLTGASSNPVSGVNSPLIPNGLTDPPDPVNAVSTTDFTIVSFTGATPTVAYVRQVGPEWCAGIDAPNNSSNIQVQFNFHAVYNRVDIGNPIVTIDKDADDQPASLQLPANRLVEIKRVVELRHVTLDGRTPPRPLSSPMVIGATHYICLIGTVAADSLLASNIAFTPIGGPDVPGVTGITVFHKSAANEPRISSSVPNGTLCFSYTSNAPGQHAVAAYFNDSNNGGALTAAFFDTDGDGNGIVQPGPASPLITRWVRIDRTEITTGGTPTSGVVTFGTIELPLRFNVADGTFLASANLTEWVIGSFNSGTPQTTNLLVDGARLEMRIIGCGYFQVPNTLLKPTVVTGISVGGRFELNDGGQDPFAPAFGDTDANPDDIRISTTNAPNCGPSATTRIEIDVFYPGQTTPASVTEHVTIRYVFFPGQKDVRVAWAGQIVTITYAFASNVSCAGQTVRFTRPSGQPGTFLPAPGITIDGPGSASTDFGANCSATIRYESEVPGEVDIEVFIDGRPWTKIAYVIYYLVFEDITVDATPDQFVSTLGGVTANLRGYFVGSNPSGRPAETKPDGRTVPADRWVLPDDWAKLRGDPNFRSDPPEMPAAIVTFMLQNEPVRNSYSPRVTNGSSGFFVPDDPTDFSPNVNPHTKVPTVLGSLAKPRMYSQPSDGQGQATIATYGDFNLTFEECPANRITGNPHCEPEQIVGRSRYFAVAEYPEPTTRGKHPAIASNVDETTWRWAGYKRVTVVNGESPQFKYVVAHLKDRDGFCDAANFNNVLGIPIRFEIDAGSGIILEAADRPVDINGTRRFATATTFDTRDARGNPINADIAKPVLEDDECQAWIRVTNSLMKPTNVMVTFPAMPAPIPGDVTITAFSCTGQESITVTNRGSSAVNLAGFGLKSPGGQTGIAEHLDLSGILEPGQSKTFFGGPGATSRGWIGNTGERILGPGDYVALTWDDVPLATAFCSTGQIIEPFIPSPLPPDPEGALVLDVVIPWGDQLDVPLTAGWNLVPTGQGTVPVANALGDNAAKVAVIYAWDGENQEWLRYIPGAPGAVNTLAELGRGRPVWVYVNEPFTLTLPR